MQLQGTLGKGFLTREEEENFFLVANDLANELNFSLVTTSIEVTTQAPLQQPFYVSLSITLGLLPSSQEIGLSLHFRPSDFFRSQRDKSLFFEDKNWEKGEEGLFQSREKKVALVCKRLFDLVKQQEPDLRLKEVLERLAKFLEERVAA